MAGETGPLAEIANQVSQQLLKWFRWERLPLKDRNFDCVKQAKHAHANKKQKHTHPTDVVFKYRDPYLNKFILFNTDLKSYAKSSISAPNIKGALKSLAQTIDCARVSPEWRERYIVEDGAEIRGMLFVYNHDAEFDDNFERFLQTTKLSNSQEDVADMANVPLESNQLIHLMEPRTIAYLDTIVTDTAKLHTAGSFPKRNYYFFYPDQKLHKAHYEKMDRPATIELLCGPYMIIGHDAVIKYNEETEKNEATFGAGYVVYYNRSGSSHLEFMYLFDVLSSYQLLDGENQIRIRVAHHMPHLQIKSNYLRAIKDYAFEWGIDEFFTSKLEAIQFEVLAVDKKCFSKTDLGWEHSA